jgi:predicted membrane protein DUF2157
MTTERYVEEWRTAGIITEEQCSVLLAIVRKERFSVFLELNALLYLGVVAFVAGLGWTIREHFANLGDALILVTLAALFGASLFYCFTRTAPYSPGKVESPTFAFDYVLYLGCLTFAVGLGYVEFRFHLLEANWDQYLLASAVLFFVFAYRFDNRFVLSLALSTLAGWFGVRLSAWHVLPATTRALALVYGGVVAGVGVWMHRRRIKAHFLDAYLHVAVNAVLLSLTSAAMERDAAGWWIAGLLAASAAIVALGIRFRRFAFVAYGVVYAYVGIGAQVLHHTRSETLLLAYFVASGIAVVGGLAWLARLFGRDT